MPQLRQFIATLLLVIVLGPAALAGQPGRLSSNGVGGYVREPDYKLQVSAGMSGQCRTGWVPVYVSIEASRSFDGDLVARMRGGSQESRFEVRRKLKLAPGSTTEYHLYLRYDDRYSSAEVEVCLEQGKPLESTVTSRRLTTVADDEYLICAVTDVPNLRRPLLSSLISGRHSSYSSGNNQTADFTVVQPNLAELPDRAAGYNGVDCLLLYQVSFEKLRPAQLNAILDYLWRGGRVMLAAKDRAWFARPEIQALVPLRLESSGTDSITTLAQRHGAFSGGGPGTLHKFAIPNSSSSPGFVLAHRGLGTVICLELDPANEAVATWTGLQAFCGEMANSAFVPRHGDSCRRNYDSPLLQARETARRLRLDRERSVSALLIVFLVVIYLVLVGPINYFVLRKMDRRALSIITLPALALVFVLVNFAVGYASRGVVTSSRRLTVAVAPSGATRADCVTWLGVFPAGSMLADVSTDGVGLVLPLLNSREDRQTTPTTLAYREIKGEERLGIERQPLRMWEMFHFMAESARPLGGSVRLVRKGADGFELTNGTSLKLRDCLVVSIQGGPSFRLIGDLAPGASISGSLGQAPQPASPGTRASAQNAPLPLPGVLRLWLDGNLSQDLRPYSLDQTEDGFGPQAAQILSSDARLESSRPGTERTLLLFAKVEEEFEPLRFDGKPPRGESARVLVVTAEPEPPKGGQAP